MCTARDKAGTQRSLDEVFALFPILDEEARTIRPARCRGGQQQMVAIGRAMMGRPKVLLLDEPSLGLAPLVVKQVFEVIQRINRAGTTVLLAEQNAFCGAEDRAPCLRDRERPHRAGRRSRILLNNEARMSRNGLYRPALTKTCQTSVLFQQSKRRQTS